MTVEKRTLVLTHFPRFLTMLEEEVYSNNSPIWDPEYTQAHSIATAPGWFDFVDKEMKCERKVGPPVRVF